MDPPAPKLYTRKGDQGQTCLVNGTRVPKYDLRLEAAGDLDELTVHLGAILSTECPRRYHSGGDVMVPQTIRSWDVDVEKIQNIVMGIATIASTDFDKDVPDYVKPLFPTETQIAYLEGLIDYIQESLPPLKNFILPRGPPIATAAHMARVVCRRAERRLVGAFAPMMRTYECILLPHNQYIDGLKMTLAYINRLSDYLFALSRKLGSLTDVTEKKWTPRIHPYTGKPLGKDYPEEHGIPIRFPWEHAR